jgi:choline dehydrogenase-like flavoprotein
MQHDDPGAPLDFGGSGHIMGTTRMGNNATDSVVDKNCRAHNHQNLFVLGSSVFPTSSTANPTSTIAALSLRAAEAIKAQLRSQ